MFKKRILPIIIVAAIVVVAIIGGRYAYQRFHTGNKNVEVIPVSSLNWGYYDEGTTSYGTVTNDSMQEIMLSESDVVTEVFVTEGQTVAKGDPLLAYDMTEEALRIEMQQLAIQQIDNDIVLEQRKLDKLQATVPVEEPVETDDTLADPATQQAPVEEKSGDAYQFIQLTAKPYEGDGSAENPYRFLCTQEAYVLGEYLNYLAEHQENAVFEVHNKNRVKGKVIYSWEVQGSSLPLNADAEAKWEIKTRQQVTEELPEEIIEEELAEETTGGVTYTAQELAEAIAECRENLSSFDIQKRKEQLTLQQMQQVADEGVVKATIDGVVLAVNDEATARSEGTAFITVSGSEGLYVKGSISELMLDKVKVGMTVTAMSWDTGNSFEATITEIDEYPTSNNEYYGSGNPNVSNYGFTAYIEDTEGLSNGEYLDLTITSNGEASSGIYLERAYVREENGQSYVMKAQDGVLVKQYVETGKIAYGEAVEIKSGLTQEDYIAFPYGDGAVEGIAVSEDMTSEEDVAW